tara:strand:+ start:14162 stop:15709 length:1548 start_codon:yes stop_codon:yes gene_type:complete
MNKMEFEIEPVWQSRFQKTFLAGTGREEALHFCSIKVDSVPDTLESEGISLCKHWLEQDDFPRDGILLLHLERKRKEFWNTNQVCVYHQLYEFETKNIDQWIRGCTWKGESETSEWISLIELVDSKPLECIAKHFGVAIVSPDEPLRLEELKIPKPWGHEGWYTGVEKRGVASVFDHFGCTELPYALGLFPEKLLNGHDKKLILLKTLNPLSEAVMGDLYLEMHEKKWEVYVVTALDPEAWPSGTGRILAGLNSKVKDRYHDRFGASWREPLLLDFQEQIQEYEITRRKMDQLLDQLKEQLGISGEEEITPQQLADLENKLPQELRKEEALLREKAYSFIGSVPVKVGDVVTFPAMQIHSLQHGIRVIEFQTPHYERLIVMFAQKVLTQDHWDTERAIRLLNTEPYQLPEPVSLIKENGFIEERIVDFPDFTVERIQMVKTISKEFCCEGNYHLLICVSGVAHLESESGKINELLPGPAFLLAAGTRSYRISNKVSETLIFLRAVPVKNTMGAQD